MQNLLTLMKRIIKNYERKKQTEYDYKVNFLRQQTYLYYLTKSLSNDCSVDLPHFLYFSGKAIHMTAWDLTNIVIDMTVKRGRRHVDKCYKYCLKSLKRR